MTVEDPAQATGREIVAAVRAQRWSVEQVAQACLYRIDARDATIRAWAHVDADAVLQRARVLDACSTKGPLHGLPIGVKDVFLTSDMPTSYNAPAYASFRPNMDAACIATLRAAGALLVGKTQTVEFGATGAIPPTCNPHNIAHTPGGSSSGSAAAVADRHVPITLGTQTGGSLMRPASYCGVYAMKPTWGAVSREGVKTFSDSLDTVGWFARTADDLGLLLDIFGVAKDVATALCLRDARIAVCRTPVWDAAEKASREAIDHICGRLSDAGAVLTELALPESFNDLPAAHGAIMRAEGGVTFLSEYRVHGDSLHQSFKDHVRDRSRVNLGTVRDALDLAAVCRIQFDALASPFDAVIAPSATGAAPPGLASTGSFTFNGLWTALHVPCANIPAYRDPVTGLPVGITVISPRFSDGRVLAAARAIAGILKI